MQIHLHYKRGERIRKLSSGDFAERGQQVWIENRNSSVPFQYLPFSFDKNGRRWEDEGMEKSRLKFGVWGGGE